ncbi:NAD(P)-binding protein [Favolaschia claudopus]|uniref:NAD(P)-binding protein n=1 Tax=Favolaschia claudopus TaxID=2862362 RepID=A0AAW0EAF8_9AGAR
MATPRILSKTPIYLLLRFSQPATIDHLARPHCSIDSAGWDHRDARRQRSSKPAAEAFAAQGVQVKAFNGAEIAFVVTNFNEHMDKERDISEGKMFVDTAKLVGVKLLVWSGLESLSALSNGKFSRVGFFDAKKAVTEYAKSTGVPLWELRLWAAYPPTTQVPLIDVAHDYGLYVRAAIEDPSSGTGSEVLSGRLISLGEIVATLSEEFSETLDASLWGKIEYLEMDRETFIATTGMPDYGALLSDMFEAFAVHGYYGGKEITNERLLGRKPHLWSEFLGVTPVKELLK